MSDGATQSLPLSRETEIDIYRQVYRDPKYAMGERRKSHVQQHLAHLPTRGGLLDIGTGRGEALVFAARAGFLPVHGTEVVPSLLGPNVTYAEAHALPFEDASFDVVSCWDVLEHLLPEDVAPALREMSRVARRVVIASASEKPSSWIGRDLHISARPAAAWFALMRECWGPGELHQVGFAGESPCWRLVKP